MTAMGRVWARRGACLVKLAPAVRAPWPEYTDCQRCEGKTWLEHLVPAQQLHLASYSSRNCSEQVSFFLFTKELRFGPIVPYSRSHSEGVAEPGFRRSPSESRVHALP